VINIDKIPDLRDNLQRYSAKYHHIVEFVKAHPREPTFIFTPIVSGGGGAIFLGLILGLFGYSKAHGNEKSTRPRYALITGDDKSSIQRKSLIEIFNSPENANGEIIQIMIATKTISEGTSFTNVRHEIVVSPYWNNSGTEQAVGRGLRANSLAGLSKDERVVTVQEMALTSANLPVDKNIDAHMYKMSEAKDFEIRSAERILKRAAWDCPLNYSRNVRVTDTDDSRNCDYQKCNYVCYQTTPKKIEPKWIYAIPAKELDRSTYLLYYSNPEMLKMVKKIKGVLKKHQYIDIRGLDKIVGTEDFKLLVLAIEYIIENHITVYNRWGQRCFLRREGNMLFMSEIPTEREIMGSWYSLYPYANQKNPLSEVIDDEIIDKDLAKMDGFDPTATDATKIISDLSLESQILIFETLTSLEPSTNRKAFLDLFKNHSFKIEDLHVHDLAKIKLQLDYIDFTKGENGDLRCLRDESWGPCNKKEEDELSATIKELKGAGSEEVADNKFGIYGVLTTDGKFQIVDKTKEKGGDKDLRTKYTGKVCNYWQKWQLIEIFLRVSAEPEVKIDTSIRSKKELLAEINDIKTEKAVPPKATVATLQKILTLSKLKITELCDELKGWFEKNNLIINQL
jgi:hypothetical protein